MRTLEKAARSTADAMSGLEDALKRALGSSSGIDAAVREGLMEALRNEAREWAPIGVSMVKGKSENGFLKGGSHPTSCYISEPNVVRPVAGGDTLLEPTMGPQTMYLPKFKHHHWF